jgi:3-oxoadipate enol-lactonase
MRRVAQARIAIGERSVLLTARFAARLTLLLTALSITAAGCVSRGPSAPIETPPSRPPIAKPVPPSPSPSPSPPPPPVVLARTIEANGTRLYYELTGPSTVETIIFIHHFTLDARMWDEQWNEFRQRYRVLRYDARGFGRSGAITGPYSIREDLRALMDALGIQRAHLVGHSMGGRYAIDFALDYPTRVRTLIVSDPSISGEPFSAGFSKEFGHALDAGRTGAVDEAKRRWLATSLFSATRQRPEVMRRVSEMVASYSGWHFRYADPAAQTQPPATDQLGRLRVPMLVIVGERSIADFHSFGDKLQREAPVVRRVTLREVGHMSNMESPAAYNRAVREFIERPPAAVISDRPPTPVIR